MASDQSPSVTLTSVECSDSATPGPRALEEAQRSLYLIRAAPSTPVTSTSTANFVSKSAASEDTGDPCNDDDGLNDDQGRYLVESQVSRQDSMDRLAKEYDEMRLTDSSDEEQVHGGDKKVHHHARKFARGYLEIKRDFDKLKAKHESHWTFAEVLQNEKKILQHELEQLKAKNHEQETSKLKERENHERETSKLKERIRQLEAMSDMLQYGTQGECGVCGMASKVIIESHPYSKVVLETIFGANYFGILDLQQDKSMEPSSCRWRHLCGECDSATGIEEKRFKDYLEDVLEGRINATSGKIFQSHADLFHVYTFRALLRNVNTHHYVQEKDQQCSCSELLHPLNNFRKRAHHLSKPFIWKNRPEDQLIDPFQAGMLFHVSPCDTVSTSGHWIEFPVICKVRLEPSGSSHFIIFAQIPPFYWAFPLPLEGQDVPDTISDDMITSETVAKAHYETAVNDATQLSGNFEKIIAVINRELEIIRSSLDSRLQKWRDQLKKKKEEVLKMGTELEAEEKACKDEEEDLHKKIAEIEEKREKNKKDMTDIRDNMNKLEKEEKTTCIAKEKKSCNHQLESYAGRRRQVIRDNQDLNKMETECNDMLEKNASKQEELIARKLKLIKKGLYADLEPKLMIGYFRAISPCYLEVCLQSMTTT